MKVRKTLHIVSKVEMNIFHVKLFEGITPLLISDHNLRFYQV